MGMPITSYKVLHLLSDPGAARYDAERALLRAIKSYRLLAVVVHDPARHRDLHKVLTRRFGWLDMVTGPALLFFALVEVGERWRGARDSLHPLHSLEQRLPIASACAAPLPSVDPELSVLTAADRLGVSVRDLPCIVVFDVISEETCMVRTSAGTVDGQLQRIALLANNLPPSTQSQVRSNHEEAGGESGSSLESKLADYEVDALETSLPKHANVLSELLDGMAPSVSEDDKDALARSRRAVLKLTTTLTELLQAVSREPRLPFAEDELLLEDELGRAAVRLGMAIVMRNGGTTQVGWNLPPRDQWEIEAAGSLATALKLRALNDPDLILPTVLCYARSFEAEMNASVVQDLRRRLGARMPEHYCMPTGGAVPKLQVTGSSGSFEVDLDAVRNRRWHPPGLGQSELAARQMGHGEAMRSDLWDLLLAEWSILRQQRNRAAHPGGVGPPPCASACDKALSRLSNDRVLESMFELKRRLRDGG